VYAGLQAAANFATVFGDVDNAVKYRETAAEVKTAALKYLWCEQKGYFYRYLRHDFESDQLIGDETLESSTYAMFFFELLPPDDPKVVSTMNAIKDKLWVKTPVGGIARYQNDYYHQIAHDVQAVPGNPWVVCTMWLAQWYIALAQTMEGLEPALELLEWVNKIALPSGLLPEQFHPYTGEAVSVAPLTWSHAAYVTTVTMYLDKYKKIAKRERLRNLTSPRVQTGASSLSYFAEQD
jgi:GH15 family glucan-1,4-alpha-glucosidase